MILPHFSDLNTENKLRYLFVMTKMDAKLDNYIENKSKWYKL